MIDIKRDYGTLLDFIIIHEDGLFPPKTVVIENPAGGEDTGKTAEIFKSIPCRPLFDSSFFQFTVPGDDGRPQWVGVHFMKTDSADAEFIATTQIVILNPDSSYDYGVARFVVAMAFDEFGQLSGLEPARPYFDDNGKFQLQNLGAEAAADLKTMSVDDFETKWYSLRISFSALDAFALLHQRHEVDLIHYPRQKRRRIERKKGKAPSPYFLLRVDPSKPHPQSINDHSAGSGQAGKKALHIVRGHFRHVSGHPIAQFNGTHWIASHMRGSGEEGQIDKGYYIVPAAD